MIQPGNRCLICQRISISDQLMDKQLESLKGLELGEIDIVLMLRLKVAFLSRPKSTR